MNNLKELDIDGYTVLKNIITEPEIEKLYHAYLEISNKKREIVKSLNTGILNAKIHDLMFAINTDTSLKLDVISFAVCYFDTAFYSNNWHQDHESILCYKDAFNAINLWIPLVKPDEHKSGLDIIPFSKLSPTDITYFKGFGARRLMSENNRTYALDDNNGGHRTNFSFDLTELSVSPAISVGDVLVMRGDTIHRSQDTNTHRIAISIRCFKRV
jgi:ectoine hydroxylase-related dioxygenase (phytanoyl-CoA dioxygenase family)